MLFKLIYWALAFLFLFVPAWGAVILIRKIRGQEQNKKINGLWMIALVLVLLSIVAMGLLILAISALWHIG